MGRDFNWAHGKQISEAGYVTGHHDDSVDWDDRIGNIGYVSRHNGFIREGYYPKDDLQDTLTECVDALKDIAISGGDTDDVIEAIIVYAALLKESGSRGITIEYS